MIQFSTWDASFDGTFADYIVFPDLTAPTTCRLDGTHLAWLDACGWGYWLFANDSDTDLGITVGSSFEQAGVLLDSFRTGQTLRTVRTSNLTTFDAQVLSGIMTSPAVYILDTNTAGKVVAIRVRAEPGTLPTWRDSANRINMEFKLVLPKRKYQMA